MLDFTLVVNILKNHRQRGFSYKRGTSVLNIDVTINSIRVINRHMDHVLYLPVIINDLLTYLPTLKLDLLNLERIWILKYECLPVNKKGGHH